MRIGGFVNFIRQDRRAQLKKLLNLHELEQKIQDGGMATLSVEESKSTDSKMKGNLIESSVFLKSCYDTKGDLLCSKIGGHKHHMGKGSLGKSSVLMGDLKI